MMMTKEALQKACTQNGGYRQPHLNEQLFLQCKGFCEMQNLDEYTDLRALWLDQNAIAKIENVEHLRHLTSLFLQNNALRSTLGLRGLSNLRTLNLSNNCLTRLDGVADACPLLETLQVSHNRIVDLDDLADLQHLPELGCLDASFNLLEAKPGEDALAIVAFFKKVPKLSVLYLHGQDLTRTMKQYRKNLILHLDGLTYLDERPVFPEERRSVAAWGIGGPEAERAELESIRNEKEAELRSRVTSMTDMMERNRETREARQREWELRQEAELARQAARRVELKRLATELDHEEYEARADVEAEQQRSFDALLTDAAISSDDARASQAARVAVAQAEAAQRKLEEEAARELEVQRSAMLAAAEAQRQVQRERFDEMRFWVKQLEQADAEVEATMQREMDALLSGLEPGADSLDAAVDAAATEEELTDAVVSHTVRRRPRRWKQGSALWDQWVDHKSQ